VDLGSLGPKALASNAHTYRLSVFKERWPKGRLMRSSKSRVQLSAKTAILARFEGSCQARAFEKDKKRARLSPV
jgi:hypothetical protein